MMEGCDAVGVGMDSEPKVHQKAEIEEESRTSDRMGGSWKMHCRMSGLMGKKGSARPEES